MRNLAAEQKINIIKTLSISKNIHLFIYLFKSLFTVGINDSQS